MSDRPAQAEGGEASSSGCALVLIYTTLPDLEAAETFARSLVEAGLVACANLLPGMVSLYQWDGKLERSGETVALLKTPRAKLSAALAQARALHPYDAPALIVIEPASVNAAYLDWACG